MIESKGEESIVAALAALISYGLSNRFSLASIEEYIANSAFIRELENCRFTPKEEEALCKEVYRVEGEIASIDIDFESRFYAEIYVYLFFKMQKSFEYLFLYMPISDLIDNYEALHTADYSKVEAIVEERRKSEKLLSRLASKRKTKLTALSSLTGININTIKKYAYSDERLFDASMENIVLLSSALGVKENIFCRRLFVFIDDGAYGYDKTDRVYRNYLGLLFISYFDAGINFSSFHYDEKENAFVSNKEKTRVRVFTEDIASVDFGKTIDSSPKDTYFVFFDYSWPGFDASSIDAMVLNRAREVAIINQEYCQILKRHRIGTITDTVNRILIMRAKEYASQWNAH